MALQSVASENFTGTVATFTAGYAEPIGNFAVTIQWGDGTTTTGTVQQGPGDTYLVVGSHTYANAAPECAGHGYDRRRPRQHDGRGKQHHDGGRSYPALSIVVSGVGERKKGEAVRFHENELPPLFSLDGVDRRHLEHYFFASFSSCFATSSSLHNFRRWRIARWLRTAEGLRCTPWLAEWNAVL